MGGDQRAFNIFVAPFSSIFFFFVSVFFTTSTNDLWLLVLEAGAIYSYFLILAAGCVKKWVCGVLRSLVRVLAARQSQASGYCLLTGVLLLLLLLIFSSLLRHCWMSFLMRCLILWAFSSEAVVAVCMCGLLLSVCGKTAHVGHALFTGLWQRSWNLVYVRNIFTYGTFLYYGSWAFGALLVDFDLTYDIPEVNDDVLIKFWVSQLAQSFKWETFCSFAHLPRYRKAGLKVKRAILMEATQTLIKDVFHQVYGEFVSLLL